jgi:hypothetical protein
MRTFSITILAALLAANGLTGTALAQQHGNPHGCINPAGHVRGWCKQNGGTYAGRSSRYTTISGTVLAVNGDIAQFREDNGATITINQGQLLQTGQPLSVGAHYTLTGYFSNNMFVVQTNGGYGNGYPGNGYPYPGTNASVHGLITSISGNRVTIMQGLFSTITIDDQQALNNGTAQNLYVGRSITAYGYWNGGTFFAVSIG